MSNHAPANSAEILWDLGQQHLAAGRYVSARQYLESAENMYWRKGDFAALARVYLPLLEVRRQLRQLAVDGVILIGEAGQAVQDRVMIKSLLAAPCGVIVAGTGAAARQIIMHSRRTGRVYDSLVLVRGKTHISLCAAHDSVAAAGLRVTVPQSSKELVNPEINADMLIPLPPAGAYRPGTPRHAQARESLLIVWEALALKWQSRHQAAPEPRAELNGCRNALAIDPACEPITMRLITLAEKMAKLK